MSDSLRRVSVHIDHPGQPIAVDLSVPAGLRIGDVVPAVVDLGGLTGRDHPAGWRLARVGGPALDEAMTLAEHGIRDGDLLVMSVIDPPAPRARDGRDLAAVVAAGVGASRSAPIAAALVGLWAIVAGAGVLLWAGLHTSGAGPGVTTSALAMVAGIATVTAHFASPDFPLRGVGSAATVGLATVAGFVIVPGGPAAPNVLLAGAAAASTSLLLLRITRCDTTGLAAAATASTLTALAAATAVVWPLTTAVTGAVLACASLAVLGIAARLAALMCGLSPPVPVMDSAVEDDEPDAADGQVMAGHRVLSGLVIGSSGSALLGVTAVAANATRAPSGWSAAVTFAAVIGAVLVLRARTHVDPYRRSVLVITGIACLTTGFIGFAVAVPQHALWSGVVTVAAGLAIASPLGAAGANPLARRTADLLEYLALAAVAPSACWVADLFALLRGASLT